MAMRVELTRCGAQVTEAGDTLTIQPGGLHGAEIDTYGDHRIAMAFTVAALIAKGDSEIAGAECVAVSFPEFFRVLESIVQR